MGVGWVEVESGGQVDYPGIGLIVQTFFDALIQAELFALFPALKHLR
jgi:hypothetical protein